MRKMHVSSVISLSLVTLMVAVTLTWAPVESAVAAPFDLRRWCLRTCVRKNLINRSCCTELNLCCRRSTNPKYSRLFVSGQKRPANCPSYSKNYVNGRIVADKPSQRFLNRRPVALVPIIRQSSVPSHQQAQKMVMPVSSPEIKVRRDMVLLDEDLVKPTYRRIQPRLEPQGSEEDALVVDEDFEGAADELSETILAVRSPAKNPTPDLMDESPIEMQEDIADSKPHQ